MFFKKAQQIAKSEEKPMYTPVIASNEVQKDKDEVKMETIEEEIYTEPNIEIPTPSKEQEVPQETEELSEEDKEIEALEQRKLQIMEEKAARLQEEASRMKETENAETHEQVMESQEKENSNDDLITGAIQELVQRLERIESSLYRARLL